ncbi:MAG: DUF6526 family protein [Candidatus Eisenbacteria bacterium]
MSPSVQTHSNHARYVPLYHFVLGGIVAINLAYAANELKHGMTQARVLNLLMAVGFVILFWYARAFALAVQDRVIRLEMRLRLEKLLSPQQFARFDQVAPGQIVALRFASDAEMPGLISDLLDGKLDRPGDIKRRIQNWQADRMRA